MSQSFCLISCSFHLFSFSLWNLYREGIVLTLQSSISSWWDFLALSPTGSQLAPSMFLRHCTRQWTDPSLRLFHGWPQWSEAFGQRGGCVPWRHLLTFFGFIAEARGKLVDVFVSKPSSLKHLKILGQAGMFFRATSHNFPACESFDLFVPVRRSGGWSAQKVHSWDNSSASDLHICVKLGASHVKGGTEGGVQKWRNCERLRSVFVVASKSQRSFITDTSHFQIPMIMQRVSLVLNDLLCAWQVPWKGIIFPRQNLSDLWPWNHLSTALVHSLIAHYLLSFTMSLSDEGGGTLYPLSFPFHTRSEPLIQLAISKERFVQRRKIDTWCSHGVRWVIAFLRLHVMSCDLHSNFDVYKRKRCHFEVLNLTISSSALALGLFLWPLCRLVIQAVCEFYTESDSPTWCCPSTRPPYDTVARIALLICLFGKSLVEKAPCKCWKRAMLINWCVLDSLIGITKQYYKIRW